MCRFEGFRPVRSQGRTARGCALVGVFYLTNPSGAKSSFPIRLCIFVNSRIQRHERQLGRRRPLAHSRLRLIYHERRHLIEEFPKNLLGLFRQRSFLKSTIHQTHPSVAGSLIDGKRRMPRAEARMASLFDVSLRPPEPTDQEISEALLSTREILRRVHGPKRVFWRAPPIEGGDQARETFGANHGINFD